MSHSFSGSGQPAKDDVRYERVDPLTVNVFVEGEGDTTVRPPSPAVRKILERDRALIDQLNARFQREHTNGKDDPPDAGPPLK